MVEHQMGLFQEGFELIESGKKKIEIRLNDEKRKGIKVGDAIKFHLLPERKKSILVTVCSLAMFSDFKSLYDSIDFKLLGREDKTAEWMLEASYDYYTREDELRYGILAIEFEIQK